MARGRSSGIIGIIIGLIVLTLGVFALLFVLNGGGQDGGAPDPVPDIEPEPAPDGQDGAAGSFADYSWEEIGEIATLMEQAGSEDEARAIAREYGLVDEAGNLTTQTHTLVLDNGVTADVRLVGIYHDTKADGGGRAALTFMTSPIDFRRINSTPSSEGGWKGSDIRSWLRSDGIGVFPDELASRIVSVTKMANNAGKTTEVADIEATYDPLWLFSCREVCGEITWLSDEFDYLAEDNDAILNSEGSQYEAFRREGVDQYSDSSAYLTMYYQGKAVPWWYRTPYAFEYMVSTEDAFYQVTATGYVSAVNLADEQAGIVVGFCM